MKRIKNPATILGALAITLIAATSAHATVTLPAVFGNHMVLQREMSVPIWGSAKPGERVTVQFAGQSQSTTAGADGNWRVKLSPLKADATGRDLVVSGSNKITLHDVLVGEVWLCSGQSNMEFPINGWTHTLHYQQQIANAAKHPTIRLINVPHRASISPQQDFRGDWQVASPKSVPHFTAVGYLFAVNLQKSVNVPIGLLESDWGGTTIQPWIPLAGWKAVPQLKSGLQRIRRDQRIWEQNKAAYAQKIAPWVRQAKVAVAQHKPIPDPPGMLNDPLAHRYSYMALHNGMTAPLVPYAIRGAIWYQGESNVLRPQKYFYYLKGLIQGWRTIWNQGDFPVILVQIAPYSGYGHRPPTIWQKELKAARKIKNVGIISTIDIGNLVLIHPKDKQDVGKRLALWARANVYGHKNIIYSGPRFESMNVQGDKAVIHFSHLGGGLVCRKGKALTNFEITGKDGQWTHADAKIQGATVVVHAAGVSHPTAVRFAWSYQAQPNLKNKAGLPAFPFNTENR